MNTATGAQGTGFLAALTAVAKHEGCLVQIDAKNSTMRVNISVTGYPPMEAVGSAAALEAKLPAAIKAYAQWLDEQVASGEVKIDLPGSRPARKPRIKVRKKTRATKKVVVRPKQKKKAAPRRAPAAKKKPAATSQTGLAGKPECIADYKALKAKHGNKLTRRLFVDNAKTGRRYEKLWGNSWPTFVKEADGGKPASAAAAPAKPAASKPKKAAPKHAAKPAKPKKDAKPGPWIVKAKGGKQLGATILEKKIGDAYNCSAGEFTVESVNAEKREILVVPKNTGIALPGSSAPPPAGDPAPALSTPAPQPDKVTS